MQRAIDRNVVRRSDLVNAPEFDGVDFILTDTFLVEMVRNPDAWINTFRADFAALAPVRHKIKLGLSVGESLRIETDEKRAITREDLLPAEFQPILDELLQASSAGDDLPNELILAIKQMLPALSAEQPEASAPKIKTQFLTDRLPDLLAEEVVSDLGKGRLRDEVRFALVKETAIRLYAGACYADGTTPLPVPSSITFRFYLCKAWRAIWWLTKHGLEAAKDQTIYNDAYDDEYVLIGSFFDGVVSNEKRVVELNSAMRRIIEGWDTAIYSDAAASYFAGSGTLQTSKSFFR